MRPSSYKSHFYNLAILGISLFVAVFGGLSNSASASNTVSSPLSCNNSNELLKKLIMSPETIQYYEPGGPEHPKEYYSLGEPLTHAESSRKKGDIVTLTYPELSVEFIGSGNGYSGYNIEIRSLKVNQYHKNLDYELSSFTKSEDILRNLLGSNRQEIVKILGHPIDINAKYTKYACEGVKRKYILEIETQDGNGANIIWTYK